MTPEKRMPPAARIDALSHAGPAAAPSAVPAPAPWWRFGIVWLAVGLPALVVVAALATAAIAWRHADAVVTERGPEASGAAAARAKTDALAPAVGARNHAATPGR